MLVLSRKRDEVIVIGKGKDAIKIVVVGIKGGQVKLGITAPPDVVITRKELLEKNE